MKKTSVALLSLLLVTVALTVLAFAPAPAVAENCWLQSRWVVIGCCGFSHTKLKQQERLCCEFTGCRSWQDTGATKCEGACW
jgi:hypothetical protein